LKGVDTLLVKGRKARMTDGRIWVFKGARCQNGGLAAGSVGDNTGIKKKKWGVMWGKERIAKAGGVFAPPRKVRIFRKK